MSTKNEYIECIYVSAYLLHAATVICVAFATSHMYVHLSIFKSIVWGGRHRPNSFGNNYRAFALRLTTRCDAGTHHFVPQWFGKPDNARLVMCKIVNSNFISETTHASECTRADLSACPFRRDAACALRERRVQQLIERLCVPNDARFNKMRASQAINRIRTKLSPELHAYL